MLPEDVQKKAKVKLAKKISQETTTQSVITPVPPPPPPPPLPTPRPIANEHRLKLLDHVRHYAGHIKHNLRPVIPVEKRAFRVGGSLE